jgi:hypothetical protein
LINVDCQQMHRFGFCSESGFASANCTGARAPGGGAGRLLWGLGDVNGAKGWAIRLAVHVLVWPAMQ